MSIRNALNRSPMIVAAAVVVVIVVAGWSIYNSTPKGPASGKSAYYSTDDGQTWFVADTREVPPITHDGKPAVRAYLFTCPDGKQFAGYLERYTDQAKAVLDQFAAAKAAAMKSGGAKPNVNIAAVQAAGMGGRQVKKPGAKEWTNGNGPGAMPIRQVTCPNGQAATPVEQVN